MFRYLGGPLYDYDSYVAPIKFGGTYADISLIAQAHLGYYRLAEVSKPNGPLGLTSGSLATVANFSDNTSLGRNTVAGATIVYINQTFSYKIADYDDNTVYLLQVVEGGGSVTRTKGDISYNTPATAGLYGFYLNGRLYSIQVNVPSVDKPAITTPVNSSTMMNYSLDSIATAFTPLGLPDTHSSSDWQIATDAGFTNVIISALFDSVNKTTWQPYGLSKNSTYYMRVRYTGATLGTSPWSNTISYTTRSELLASGEEARRYASDAAANTRMGASVAMSGDGLRIVAGSPNTASIYIFRRDPTGWIQEQKITGTASSLFGQSVDITDAGDRIIVGAPNETANSNSTAGITYIYHRSGTTWTLKNQLIYSGRSIGQNAGTSVAISADGNYAISGVPLRNINTGGAVIFAYNSTTSTWAEQTFLTNTAGLLYKLGSSVTIDATGSTIVMGGPANGSGMVRWWKRVGTTWTELTALTSARSVSNEMFGYSVAISGNGLTLVCSCRNSTENSATSAGRVDIYERTADTFTLKNSVNAGAATAGGAIAMVSGLPGIAVTLRVASATAYFGETVNCSYDGRVIFVGELGENNSLNDSGGGHVLMRNASGTWAGAIVKTILKMPTPVANINFGTAIGASKFGDRAVMGASLEATAGPSQSGALHIFN